jgi:flavoprotein hydroxylase
MHDLGFFYDWLIVDVILHEQRVFDPLNIQICDPARPTTAVSGGPGRGVAPIVTRPLVIVSSSGLL